MPMLHIVVTAKTVNVSKAHNSPKSSIAQQHTRTHATVYGSLDSVWNNLSEPIPEETFTHSHLSWSSVIHNLLPPSSMIHGSA